MPKSKELISSSSESDGSDDEPKQKKKKVEKKEKKSPEKPKSKATKGPGGEPMFQLSNMRFASVGEFKGKVLIGIREYYMTANDEMRPSKKGISLTLEQWQALKDNMDEIDEAIKQV